MDQDDVASVNGQHSEVDKQNNNHVSISREAELVVSWQDMDISSGKLAANVSWTRDPRSQLNTASAVMGQGSGANGDLIQASRKWEVGSPIKKSGSLEELDPVEEGFYLDDEDGETNLAAQEAEVGEGSA